MPRIGDGLASLSAFRLRLSHPTFTLISTTPNIRNRLNDHIFRSFHFKPRFNFPPINRSKNTPAKGTSTVFQNPEDRISILVFWY